MLGELNGVMLGNVLGELNGVLLGNVLGELNGVKDFYNLFPCMDLRNQDRGMGRQKGWVV